WPEYLASMAATSTQPALQRFYAADWPAADTPLAEVEFVALDIETTGLNAKRHSILSIGAIPFTLQRIRSNQAWQQLVRPQADLRPDPTVFHRNTRSDIQQAPRFPELLDDLLDQLAVEIAVGHHHSIERNFNVQAVP